jgi:hypothetical protein
VDVLGTQLEEVIEKSSPSARDDYGEGAFRSECRCVCSTAVARLPHCLKGVSHPK